MPMQAAWEHYFAASYPQGVPEDQESETRRAFYAGGFSVLKYCAKVSADFPQLEAEARMERLDQEIIEFLQSKGKAL